MLKERVKERLVGCSFIKNGGEMDRLSLPLYFQLFPLYFIVILLLLLSPLYFILFLSPHILFLFIHSLTV